MKTLHLSIIVGIGISLLVIGNSNLSFAQNVTNSSNSMMPIPHSILNSPVPTLTPSENQTVVSVALSVPGLQNWSHDWRYVSTGFLGNNKLATVGFEWQYALVYLKASSSSSLIPCDNNNDWSAMVTVDMTTMKVVSSNYPTMESHNCNYTIGGGPNTSKVSSMTESPLKQFKSGIASADVKCKESLMLITKASDHSPACVKPNTASILIERGWATNVSTSNPMISEKTNDPFGITALIIYHPPDVCLDLIPPSSNMTVHGCPPNTFYLKINSVTTAYLMGYNICDVDSCAKTNDMSDLLPIKDILTPNFQMIGLPVDLKWKYGDTVKIQLYVSPTNDNKTASLADLGNSTIVP